MKRFLDEFSEQVIDFTEVEIEDYREALLNFFNCIVDIDTKNRETLWEGTEKVSI